MRLRGDEVLRSGLFGRSGDCGGPEDFSARNAGMERWRKMIVFASLCGPGEQFGLLSGVWNTGSK